MASFARYSSLRCKTGTNDNALPEWFTSSAALLEPGQSWDLQPRKMRAGEHPTTSLLPLLPAAVPLGSSMAHQGAGSCCGVLQPRAHQVPSILLPAGG